MVEPKVKIDLDKPTAYNLRHARRYHHCLALLALDLFKSHDGYTHAVLSKYSATILPGPCLGLEYPSGASQIEPNKIKQPKQSSGNPKGTRKK